jgi:DNA-binding response OmpR family regulator
MEVARVLFIGRPQTNQTPIAQALEKRYQVIAVASGKLGIENAEAIAPHVVVLDAVSMRTLGDRICRNLRQSLGHTPIVHIHPGPKDSAQSLADAVLYHPVTPRKLTNAIDRLLTPHDENCVAYGHITLNLDRRVLIVKGQEIQLTPKQSLLVETFLSHPGKTLDRKTLMAKVWQTDYLGDTRTLDVHIRWIREAIETNPSKPTYLQTIRGVGYRLVITETSLAEITLPEAEALPVPT